MSKIIRDAIADATAVQKAATQRAKNMLLREFSPAVKSMLSEVINEQTSTGSDQPGGYSQETDQDAIGVGTDPVGKNINKNTGDGPTDADSGYTEDGGRKGSAKDVKEDADLPFDDENPEDNDDDFNVEEIDEPVIPDETDDELGVGGDMHEDDVVGNEDPLSDDNDEVIEIVDDNPKDAEFPSKDPDELTEDDEEDSVEDKKDDLMEAKKRVLTLKKENKKLYETIEFLKNRFSKVNLFNAKLAYAFKLMHEPGVTRSQKKQIAEAFDKAKTVRETQLIYSTMKKALGTRTPRPLLTNNNIKSVISESTQNQNSTSQFSQRFQELAGIE